MPVKRPGLARKIEIKGCTQQLLSIIQHNEDERSEQTSQGSDCLWQGVQELRGVLPVLHAGTLEPNESPPAFHRDQSGSALAVCPHLPRPLQVPLRSLRLGLRLRLGTTRGQNHRQTLQFMDFICCSTCS